MPISRPIDTSSKSAAPTLSHSIPLERKHMEQTYAEYLDDIITDTLINHNKRHPKQRITLPEFIENIAESLDVLARITRKRKWETPEKKESLSPAKDKQSLSLEADDNFKELQRMMLEQGWKR